MIQPLFLKREAATVSKLSLNSRGSGRLNLRLPYDQNTYCSMRVRGFQGFFEADEDLVTDSDVSQMDIRCFYRVPLFAGLTFFCVNPVGKVECQFESAGPDDRDLLLRYLFDGTFRAGVRRGLDGVR